ncbi:MAG: hypothetical protein AAGM38_06210 [Pseudomonadota bacterium]
MSDGAEQFDHRRSYEPRRLRARIEALRTEVAELHLDTDDLIREAMAPHLAAGAPGKTHFSEVINGRRKLSAGFLRALHRAFRLDRLGLSEALWFEGDDADPRAIAAFQEQVREAMQRRLDPLGWLRRIVERSRLPLFIEGGVLGIGTGAQSEHPGGEIVRLAVGSRVQISTSLSEDGYLTFFNLQADESYSEPLVHWIDPALGNVLRFREGGLLSLPETGKGVPVGGPPGLNTLVAVFWPEKPQFYWPTSTGDSATVPLAEFRRFLLQSSIDGGEAAEAEAAEEDEIMRERVGLFDYIVFDEAS